MSKIANIFNSNNKVLIPYITAGDPNLEESLIILHALADNGADIIELGIPFSDPMADGPIIQKAHERALSNKIDLLDIFKLITKFREKNKHTPIVLMSYLNPILHFGYENFAKKAQEASIDGLLVVDLPIEHFLDLNETLLKYNIDPIFLASPTTNEERIKKIAQYARGYLYYISLKGVTGSANLDIHNVDLKIKQIKKHINIPIAVGFGISDVETVKKIANIADGIVVGSYIVDSIASNLKKKQDTIMHIMKDFKRVM